MQCPRRTPEERTHSCCSSRFGRCVQQSAIQTTDETPCAIWRQSVFYKKARSSTPGKKGRHTTWKLDAHAPTSDNGTSTGLSRVPSHLQCLHKRTGGLEQQWLKPKDLFTDQLMTPTQQSLLSKNSWKSVEDLKTIQARRKSFGAP